MIYIPGSGRAAAIESTVTATVCVLIKYAAKHVHAIGSAMVLHSLVLTITLHLEVDTQVSNVNNFLEIKVQIVHGNK